MKKNLRFFIMVLLMMTSIFLLPIIGFADTDISGEINQNTIWSKEGSPYILDGEVIINKEVTLTIEDGVEVKFNNNSNIQSFGTIIAKGSQSNRINFISDKESYWYILLKGDNNNFEYCNFINASFALDFEYNNDSNIKNNNTIDNCIFRNNNYAIRFRGTYGRITNNIIQNNRYAIETINNYDTTYPITIKGNNIVNNTYGILLGAYANNIQISNNNIDNETINLTISEYNDFSSIYVLDCYWGTIDEYEIESKISGYHYFGGAIKVLYHPFLTTPYNADDYMVKSNYTSGTYDKPITVALSVYAENYDILYTLDGTSVIENVYGRNEYSIPFLISDDTIVRAVSVHESVYGNIYGEEQIFSYIINEETSNSTPSYPSVNIKSNTEPTTVAILDTQLDSTTNTAITTVSEDLLNSILDTTNKLAKIEIPKIENVNSYKVVLPSIVFNSNNVSQVEVKTEIANIIIKNNMLDNTFNNNVGVNISKVDKSTLNEEIQNQIGDKPIVGLNLEIDGQIVEWNNDKSSVVVSIPYSPTKEELINSEKIVIWYIDSNGNIATIPNGQYDSNTGMVTFETNHFSNYAVNFVDKTFNDVDENNTAKHAIEILASKGIVNGISENLFNPNASITRADFILLLKRAFELNGVFETNFDDVSIDSYYYDAVGIAKQLSIVHGIGNNMFNPQGLLTGADIKIIINNILRIKDKELENIENVLNIIDDNDIVTRTEVSIVLYNLIKK